MERLAERFENPDAVLRTISANLAEEAINLTREGFEREADPYGKTWAPRKTADNAGSNLLVRTGAMRNSWHVGSVQPMRFTIVSGVEYADYHQNGTRVMPSRMMVPHESDVPPRWKDAFDEVVVEIFERELG
ncbi:MAG: hypothetical protein GVY18_09070 [Bacteroidetes bacterium]|nr:hypothetical protein [Bacteroidota bacterium]